MTFCEEDEIAAILNDCFMIRMTVPTEIIYKFSDENEGETHHQRLGTSLFFYNLLYRFAACVSIYCNFVFDYRCMHFMLVFSCSHRRI